MSSPNNSIIVDADCNESQRAISDRLNSSGLFIALVSID